MLTEAVIRAATNDGATKESEIGSGGRRWSSSGRND
jgi:hypothetical protein